MHWILPAGIENSMYIRIAGVIPFFIFNICFLIYILNYKELISRNHATIPYGARKITILFAFCYLLYSLLHGCVIGLNDLLIQLLDNQALVYSLLLFFLYPMNSDMVERTKYIVIPTAILLSVEIILYSLGILQYSVDLGTEESVGVLRISTTVGAATGTAVIMVMLGVMLLYYTDVKLKYRLVLVTLVTIAIFFLQSRGSVLVWGLYIMYYLYTNYIRYSSLKIKVRVLLLCMLSFLILNKIGVFEPIIERQRTLLENDMVDTGRDHLKDKTFNVISKSSGFGVGIGQTNYDKSLYLVGVSRSDSIGVHNHYLCVLAELGIIGLLILLLYVLNIIRYLNFKNPTFFYILLMLTITFMTEPVFILSEFTYPASFLLMVSMVRDRNI